MNRSKSNCIRRRAARRHPVTARTGMAALEVVIVTAAIIPSLFALLWFGMHVMAAFLSVLGTMIGSPLG